MKRSNFDEFALEFCNQALEKGVVLNQWRISNIVPMSKKEVSLKHHRLQRILLISLVAKTLNRMICNRIQSKMEKKLRDNQNGFREERSTTSRFLMLRRLLEKARAKSFPAAMVFINFRKAFDSVKHPHLMILQVYETPHDDTGPDIYVFITHKGHTAPDITVLHQH